MKRLRVRDRVMTSHDACTSGTSRVLTVASLQRLRMDALIPAPADCEIASTIKFLNAKSTAPIEIHHTGLEFGRSRVQIPVPANLTGIFLWLPSAIKGNAGLDFHYNDPFDHYS